MLAMASQSGSEDDHIEQVSVGSMIADRYRLESLIDEGAMGRVFLGEHVHMRKRVAIKVLRRELTRVPEVLQRFEREALAAAHIEHPNVAGATDFGKLPDGSVYLVLEYVEGTTLRKELRRQGLGVARSLKIARQIASALCAAHALDIVHRDLKPENVMLLDRGGSRDHVKVLDFGVAKVPVDMATGVVAVPEKKRDDGALITRAGMVFGTPDYMPPEQALGQSVDARADLYSLGVVLYEMLAGLRPFRTDHELGILGQQLSGAVPPLKQRAPELDVPAEVENLVMRLLAREPSQRPKSAEDVTAALDVQLLALGEAYEPASSMRERMPSSRDSGELATLVQPPTTMAPPGLQTRLSERVRSALPAPLKGAPAWIVIFAPLLVLVSFAAIVISFGEPKEDEGAATVTSNASSASSPPVPTPTGSTPIVEPSARATEAQVEAAVEAGELAVAALLERYPNDPLARLAQARMAKQAKDADGALRQVGEALRLDAAIRDNPHVAAVLWWTVQKASTQEGSLELLKGPMKARGADILFDLAVTEGVKDPLAQQAMRWLKTRAFERDSSPEAAAAAALLLAPTCATRKALVKRAENVGDWRSAQLLRKFVANKGCSSTEKGKCNACLDAPAIDAALKAIEKRHPASEKKP